MSTDVAGYEWRLDLEHIQRYFRGSKPAITKVLAHAVVMRIGWEMDNEVCLVECDDGSKVIISTNHGSPCTVNIDEIKELVESYQLAIKQCLEVLRTITGE